MKEYRIPIFFIIIGAMFLITSYLIKPASNTSPISLPEEIYIAKPGDTLMVLEVSDSIYLGYTHYLDDEISELMEEGYSKDAASHIAKVEAGIIKADKEYNALMED